MVDPRAFRDRYGFLFWLRWILWFAASFVISASLWTSLMKLFFGEIRGGELTMTWAVSVFGSWFLLVIPFMRKKEQIWKRLNEDQEKAVDAWLLGVAIVIGLFIVSAFFWTYYFRERIIPVGAISALPLRGFWMRSVFGTWLVILIPFLIYMYRKADQIFKTAEARQIYTPKFQSQWIEAPKRLLPKAVSEKIKSLPPVLRQAHLVTAILRDGRRVKNVFVRNSEEVVGVYDYPERDFEVIDIVDVESHDLEKLPIFDEGKWVRFDIHS